jgi:hypothetical protein
MRRFLCFLMEQIRGFPNPRPTLPAIFLGALLFSAPISGGAQVTRADSAAVLLGAARNFQNLGRGQVAEALFHYISERFGNTPAGVEAIAALRVLPEEGAGQSSQVELMVWATTFGAWMGVAIPGALGADGPEAYGAGLLLGAPLGFLGGRSLARSRSLSEGQVRTITFGSLWGSWMGFGVMELFDWGEREYCDFDVCYVEGPDGPDVFKAFVIGGLAGTVTGAVLARKPIPMGVATAASLGAFWGTWFGVAGGVIAGLENDPLLASTLIGGNVGLLATAKLAPGWGVSRNRARLVSIAGVIGGLAGAGVDLLVQPDDEKVAIGIPLAGSIVGLAVGSGLTSGMDAGGGGGPGGSGGAGPSSAMASLVSVQDGQLSLGFPTPFPTMVEVENARGFSFRPALGMTLFRAGF